VRPNPAVIGMTEIFSYLDDYTELPCQLALRLGSAVIKDQFLYLLP
jgi:hypothetical protein